MSDTPPPDSPYRNKAGLARLFQALNNSLAGVADALRTERAFRLEMLLALILVPVAGVLPVTPFERALLIGSVILVLVVELLNSSIEAAIDRISLERHPLSKKSKDAGSAAVFLTLILVVVVWALVVAPYYF